MRTLRVAKRRVIGLFELQNKSRLATPVTHEDNDGPTDGLTDCCPQSAPPPAQATVPQRRIKPVRDSYASHVVLLKRQSRHVKGVRATSGSSSSHRIASRRVARSLRRHRCTAAAHNTTRTRCRPHISVDRSLPVHPYCSCCLSSSSRPPVTDLTSYATNAAKIRARSLSSPRRASDARSYTSQSKRIRFLAADAVVRQQQQHWRRRTTVPFLTA